MERSRTKSENSKASEQSADNSQRNGFTRSVSDSGVRNKSSTSSDVTGANGHRSSIVDSDCDNRKASTGSNSEYKFDTEDDSKYKGMVKNHYINTNHRSHCQQCSRKFSVKFRPHHCRRCGEIHCMKCLKYRRKLNRLANFDPNGKQRKVCKKCFNEECQTLGAVRRSTDEYCKERQLCKYERVLKQRTASLTNTFWRDQLDMQKECRRLLDGFSAAVGTSEAKKTLSEIQELVKPPKWQKSAFWQVEKLAENCRVCKGGLGIRKKKRNCKVCGLALCKKCSNRDLLLYIEGKDGEHQTQTKLAIIKVAGCPEKEPDISLLLHVCTDCKEYISSRQTNASPPSDCVDSMINMDSQFSQLQNRISPAISQCEQIIDSIESEQNQFGSEFDNVQKYLAELSDDLDTYERLFHRLRGLENAEQTKSQTNLIKHYTMAKYEYYMENRHTYRRLRNRTRPESNNRPIFTAGKKQCSGKKELENMSTDRVGVMDNDKTRSQSKPELADDVNVNFNCGSDKSDKDRAEKKTKEKKKSKQPSVIQQKFKSNNIQPNAKTLKYEDDTVNLSENSDIKSFFMRRKEISYKPSSKHNLKCSITDSGVTNDTSIISAVNSIETEQDRNLRETKHSVLTTNVTSRGSGEVFLSEGTVSWKR